MLQMYLRIFQSYVQWLESRGTPAAWARINGALTLAIAAMINSFAIIFFTQVSGGPRILDWMADHSWVTWPAVASFFAVHLLLSLRIPPRDRRQPIPRAWWTAYSILTCILAFGIGVLLIVH